MLKSLSELLEQFYEIYGRLYYNYDLINDEEKAAYISNCIFEIFKIEYKLFRAEHDTETMTDTYRAEGRNAIIIPKRRRFLLFWRKRNRAAKIVDQQLLIETEEFFRQKEEAINKLNEALDRADVVEEFKNSKMIYPEEFCDEEPEEPEEPPAAEPAAEPATEQPAQKKRKKKNRLPKEPAEQPAAENKKETVAGFEVEEKPVPGGAQISFKI